MWAKYKEKNKKTVVFVTHVIDPEIFALRDRAAEHEILFVVNGTGYIESDREKIHSFVQSAGKLGATAIAVRSGDTIGEDLSDRIAVRA